VRGLLTLATWHNGASQQEYNPLSLPRRSTTLKLFSASKPRHGLWSKPLSVQLLFLALFFLFFEKKISCAASCVFRDFRFQGHGSGVFFSVLSQCRSCVMSCLGFYCCLAPLFFFAALFSGDTAAERFSWSLLSIGACLAVLNVLLHSW
jgi:hypothetical protein